MGFKAVSPWMNLPERRTDRLLQSNTEVKNYENITQFPHVVTAP
jgi:hypothetical protein